MVRPRLLTSLLDRFTIPLTVLVAPAGLGKTTLLAQAIAENRLAPRGADRWLTCTAEDSVGSSLAEGLCRALGLPPPATVESAAETVVEAMWHRSPDEIVLVLDDVHEIAEGSSGAELLAQLVARLPRNGHLVLAGRAAPAIPLARREVSGQLLRLDEKDLLFTGEELSEFASRRHVTVSQLEDCGGWPALAELAATALPGVETTYLWQEVLAGIEPGRRRQLALLAHVGPFDDELAAAVLGHDVHVAGLTADLPLVVDTSDGGRQIHPLWRPHLAKFVSPAEIADARRRSGLLLARTGEIAAAVRLLTEADAWDEVTEVVTDALAAPDPPLRGDVVAAWLGRLPDDRANGPLGRLLAAVSAVLSDPVAAANHLADAADDFRQEGNPSGELACIAQLAQLAWWSEQPERLASLAVRLLEMEALGHDKAVPLACLARALIADVSANSEAVLTELDRIPSSSVSETAYSLVDWLRATSFNHLGRPAEALEAAERARAKSSPLHAPFVENARLEARWYLGQVDEIPDELPQLIVRAQATGLQDYIALTAAAYCSILASVGRMEDAVYYLDLARRSAAAPALPLVDAYNTVADATMAVASGDEQRATVVLEEYLDRSPPLGTGLGAFPQVRAIAIWYVLIPFSRDIWDKATLGPTFARGLELAKTLVDIRTTGRLPQDAPALPPPNIVRSLLPQSWATELALAYIGADRTAGWTLLDALWPRAQSDVQRHANAPKTPLSRPAKTALARLPVPPASKLELKLLGPVEFLRDGALVDEPEWRRERVRSLLAHLVLHRPVSRERLAADVWPSLDAGAQSRNLRVTLTHLLRVLEPERAERAASFLVRPHGASLMLQSGEWFHSDIWAFDDLWRRASDADRQGVPSVALDAMLQAVDLWRGDPSELASYEWATAEVEERRIRIVTLAGRAGELLLARGEPEAAVRVGEVALRADPYAERSHRLVVSAYVAAEDTRGTRMALERYRDALADLGMDTGEATRQLTSLPPAPRSSPPR